jgi:hypothetical protein
VRRRSPAHVASKEEQLFTSSARAPGRLGIGALGLAVLIMAMLAVPALASAKSAPVSLELGPLKAKGYTFTLTVGSCNGTADSEIDYAKGSKTDNIDYSYAGKGTCTSTGTLKRESLSISWPGVATLKLKTSAAGKSIKARPIKGCTGGKGFSRELEFKGSVDVTASKAFGTLKTKKIKGFASKISNLNCKAAPLTKETTFFAQFGSDQFIDAYLPKRGAREVFIGDEFTPATGVTGSMFIDVEGTKKTFNIAKSVATLTNVKPFASGSLTAAEQPTCTGDKPGTHNVLLTGALTVKSAVLGTLSYGAANATGGSIGPEDGSTSQCDGIGAVPLTPSVSNTCDMDMICSVQDATNGDSFFDQSTDGTQNIVSETINFGDGTPDGTFTNGEVDHTYATPGTYTATVTIVTSNGQTQTTTTPVYIDA